MSSPVTRGFNPYIHGLRGAAALAVFIYHVYVVGLQTGTYPDSLGGAIENVLATLRIGVELFFMISGYLITETLVRKASVPRFLIDRALRVYPAYIGVLLPLAVVGIAMHNEMFANTPAWSWPLHLLSNLLFLPGVFDLPILLNVGWTLSFEAAFYLVAAAAFMLYRQNRTPAAVLLCAIVGLILFARSPTSIFFFAGIAIFFYRDALVHRALRKVPPSLYLIALVVLWQIAVVDYSRAKAPLSPYFIIVMSGAFLAGLLLFDAVVHGRGRMLAALCWRPIQFIATISYSFYLWHAVVMFPLKHALMPRLLPMLGPGGALLAFGLASLLGSLIIAWLSYQLLEVRLRTWLMQRYVAPQLAALS